MTETTIPDTQYAVQLVGPGELKLNQAKDVYRPGPTQILARVEAVGLCFSDLKLLKQFSAHPRKSEVVRGLSPQTLAEYPAYRPGTQPTVPGHEAVCRIVAVGSAVRRHKIGERVLVQADWRKVRTAETNGAFGYNFEGALQEYALFDERIVIEPDTGERYLIPAPDGLSASAVALVEPWACVENSYVNEERRTIKAGGRLAVVADAGAKIAGLAECFAREGAPAAVAGEALRQSGDLRPRIG
ncbi:MAG TPA: alcohol dehydrogenase catalytic domain-containing protein, partial [Phycisphaerae bacterium]|nr:alcohol dehydrogenase catalytic domain-containing protein [Phycisphaerae bacterium]